MDRLVSDRLTRDMTSFPASRSDLVTVLGATGKTGRRIAGRLLALGVPVRAGSRAARPPFAWSDRGTWPAVLRGASAVYLSYYPDLAVPRAVDDVAGLCEIAAASGARRIVALSGRGEEGAERAEEVVRRSGMEWTIVRAGWFEQNFSEGFLLDAVLSGVVALPAGTVREPFVDVDDVADVAVSALTTDAHVGRTYELTGPRSLTFGEAVAEIAPAADTSVRHQPITPAEFEAALAGDGLPAADIELLTYLFREVLDGRNVSPAAGVDQALGRPARDFADFATSAAASGVWSTARSSAPAPTGSR